MKILLIDDEPDVLAALSDFLESKGHQVVRADNGEIAVKLLQKIEDFNLIFSDVNMPVMNGLAFLKKIRGSGDTTPVVLITAQADLETSLAALKLGALDFIVKPVHLKSVQEALDKIESALAVEKQSATAASWVTRQSITMVSNSKLDNVANIINYFNTHLEKTCSFTDLDDQKIAVCLQECLTNAIIHGNFNIQSSLKEQDWAAYDARIREREADPAYFQKNVTVKFYLIGNSIKFDISDEGLGFDPQQLPDPDEPDNWMKLSGRGIMFIRSFMDSVSWNSRGNSIQINKKFIFSHENSELGTQDEQENQSLEYTENSLAG